MRQFKHKTLGWIANQLTDNSLYYRISRNNCYIIKDWTMPKELIEDSQDREEVIEQDWIEQCYYGKKYNTTIPYLVSLEEFREDIEEYAPKFKFTNSEIVERVYGKGSDSLNQHRDLMIGTLVSFLREKNFYSADE